jgi:hypothetical protein
MSLSNRQRLCGMWAGPLLAIVLSPALAHGQQRQALAVSLVQLIATPERYDGKLVSVVGFLPFGGVDGDWLYLHKEDYDNGIHNAVAIDRTQQMLRDREKIYENYVVIIGVFRREEAPPAYVSTGRITSIQRCHFVSQPSHPLTERLKELHSHEPKQKE